MLSCSDVSYEKLDQSTFNLEKASKIMKKICVVLEGGLINRIGKIPKAILFAKEISRALEMNLIFLILNPIADYSFLLEWGANEILLMSFPENEGKTSDAYIHAILDYWSQDNVPTITLLPDTTHFQELAGLISHRMDALLYWADDIRVAENNKVNIYNKISDSHAKVLKIQITIGEPIVICVAGKTEQKSSLLDVKDFKNSSTLINVDQNSKKPLLRWVNASRLDNKLVKIENADVIIAGGRGIRNAENWNVLVELAEILNVHLAGSRAAFIDGLITEELVIGITGRKVKPKIYIAIGISGAPAHLVGMNGSEFIISINNDRNAPIVDFSDISIIDKHENFLPILINELKKVINER